jgi:hypothetical protein
LQALLKSLCVRVGSHPQLRRIAYSFSFGLDMWLSLEFMAAPPPGHFGFFMSLTSTRL